MVLIFIKERDNEAFYSVNRFIENVCDFEGMEIRVISNATIDLLFSIAEILNDKHTFSEREISENVCDYYIEIEYMTHNRNYYSPVIEGLIDQLIEGNIDMARQLDIHCDGVYEDYINKHSEIEKIKSEIELLKKRINKLEATI